MSDKRPWRNLRNEIAKLRDEAHEKYVLAVIELSMNAARKVADFEAQIEALKDDNQKIRLELESTTFLATEHELQEKRDSTPLQEVWKQFDKCKAELTRQSSRMRIYGSNIRSVEPTLLGRSRRMRSLSIA